MKSSMIDEIIRDVRDYEKTSLGTKYGADFPPFATDLTDSEQFNGIVMQVNVMALLGAMAFKPDAKEDPKAQLEGGPLREMAAMLIYLGYRMGQRDGQTKTLENMSA